MTDWLADDVAAPTTWLEIPAEARISGGGEKLRGEKTRFGSMVKRLVGKSRVWACDGEYVAFRRKQSNPATLERHNKFIASGSYKHVATHEDVEIYELQEGSAFKRTPVDLRAMPLHLVRRQAVLAGVARDWPLLVDILLEMATKIKSMRATDGKPLDSGDAASTAFANNVFHDNMAYVFEWIWKRGGPGGAEVTREINAVRERRGDSVSRVLSLPPSAPIRAVQAEAGMRPGARRLLQRNSVVIH